MLPVVEDGILFVSQIGPMHITTSLAKEHLSLHKGLEVNLTIGCPHDYVTTIPVV